MQGMTLIVKTITRLVAGFIVVFAASIILYGQVTPGGGFGGGVILACAFILPVLAFGAARVKEDSQARSFAVWGAVGMFGFLIIALGGYMGGAFFTNFLGKGTPFLILSGGTILWANIAVALNVTGALIAVFIRFVMLEKPGGKEDGS